MIHAATDRTLKESLMGHPFLPDAIPAVPEHVRPTAPDDFEARSGLLYCVRCCYMLWSERQREHERQAVPCRDRTAMRLSSGD